MNPTNATPEEVLAQALTVRDDGQEPKFEPHQYECVLLDVARAEQAPYEDFPTALARSVKTSDHADGLVFAAERARARDSFGKSAPVEKVMKSAPSAIGLDAERVARVAEQERERAQAIVAAQPLAGARILVTGYEGTELAYARMLVEAGAEVPYVSTSIGTDPLVLPDELWLRARGTREVVYRKALEEDVAALDRYPPDFVLGTTPFAAVAKERGIPAMYFTNQVASRPFFLSGGLEAILGFIGGALRRGATYREMHAFFSE